MGKEIGSPTGSGRASLIEVIGEYGSIESFKEACRVLDRHRKVRGFSVRFEATSKSVRGYFRVSLEQSWVRSFAQWFKFDEEACTAIYPGTKREYWFRKRDKDGYYIVKDAAPNKEKKRKRDRKAERARGEAKRVRAQAGEGRAAVEVELAEARLRAEAAEARLRVAELEARLRMLTEGARGP